MDNLNVDWSSGLILSCFLHVKEKYTNQTMKQSNLQRSRYCNSYHEANIRGLQVRNYNKLINVKSETSPLFQIHIHHQICNIALIQN